MTAVVDLAPKRWPRAAKLTSIPTAGWVSHVESLVVVAACGLVIYVMTKPAFTGFFYGEDFITRSLYLAADENFFKAIFTPILRIFLRPTAIAWSIGTQLFLPWDPEVHHWRNFFGLLLCLWVLYRIMVRLTDLFAARLLGISFFAISKVQLTIVGLINCIDNIGTLLYSVTTILFLVRYAQTLRQLDYWLALACFALAVGSRDANVTFAAVPLALLTLREFELGDWSRARWRQLAVLVAPFALVAGAYLALRFALVGMPDQSAYPAYAFHFDIGPILLRLKIFLGNLVNLSFGEVTATGQGDLSTALDFSAGWHNFYLVALPVLMLLLLTVVLLASWRRDASVLFPLIWACALLGPTLIISNIQIYYIFEPVAALSLFVALGIDCAGNVRAMLVAAWIPLLFVIALNGYFSDRNVDSYAWRWVADIAQRLNDNIFKPNHDKDVTGLVLIADSQRDADFLVYLVDPLISSNKNVAMLDALLSPTVRTFRAVDVKLFTRNDLPKESGPVLVYRVDSALRTFVNESDQLPPR